MGNIAILILVVLVMGFVFYQGTKITRLMEENESLKNQLDMSNEDKTIYKQHLERGGIDYRKINK